MTKEELEILESLAGVFSVQHLRAEAGKSIADVIEILQDGTEKPKVSDSIFDEVETA